MGRAVWNPYTRCTAEKIIGIGFPDKESMDFLMSDLPFTEVSRICHITHARRYPVSCQDPIHRNRDIGASMKGMDARIFEARDVRSDPLVALFSDGSHHILIRFWKGGPIMRLFRALHIGHL